VRVRGTGAPSWSLVEDSSQKLDFALYLRDAACLPVRAAVDVPPALSDRPGPIPLADGSDRDALAGEWATWWRRLVRHEMDRPKGDGLGGVRSAEGRAAVTDVVRQRWGIFDPPHFESLTDLPGLRALAVSHWHAGLTWRQAAQPGLERVELPAHAVVRAAAEEVMAAHQVPAQDIGGHLVLLAVEGAWAHPTGPGGMLCSAAAAADPEIAAGLLWDLFTSTLGPGPSPGPGPEGRSIR
jgi:hypothetical protein